MDNREILAMNLRKYRKEKGISREKFSFESGISTRFLNEIENAKCGATLDTLDKISAATGIPSSRLIEYND